MVQPQPGRSKKPAKPPYRPRLQFLSDTEYLVPSERYGGHILYKVTVVAPGRTACECTAGEHGKPCKHSRLALGAHAYRQAPAHIRPAQTWQGAAGLMELFS